MFFRPSPLGIVAALLVFLPLLFGVRALASDADWQKSYSVSLPLQDSPPPCAANSSVTATKEVTVRATLTWIGTGAPPSKIVVVEAASVSWGATLSRSQIEVPKGDPPLEPNGNMTGTGETGLTDVTTKLPDPWTSSAKGESIAGTREQKISVPSNGVCELPAVTLKATTTATTGDSTTGSATVTVGGYTVTVPDGSAHASAGFDLPPVPNGWANERIEYGEPEITSSSSTPNSLFNLTAGPGGPPELNADVNGVGYSITVRVAATQYYQYSGSGTRPELDVTGDLHVKGSISHRIFNANSAASFDIGNGAVITLFGAAPDVLNPNFPVAAAPLFYDEKKHLESWYISTSTSPYKMTVNLRVYASTE